MSEDGLAHPTIHGEYIVSLLDGEHYKVLTHHLTKLGYTAASYREKFHLPPDFPMVAAAHSRRRSAISKQTDFSNHWNQYKNKRRSDLLGGG